MILLIVSIAAGPLQNIGARCRSSRSSVPGPTLVSHLVKVRSAIQNSLAPATWANYKAAWACWHPFLSSVGHQP